MADIHEINRIEDLEPYLLAWRALHAETPEASFFNTYEWLCSYWHHYGHDQQLRVLVARAGGKPIGILPLVVRNEQTTLGSVRVLTTPFDYWGSDYQPVGACSTATYLLAAKHLASTQQDWDIFEPRWLSNHRNQVDRLQNGMMLAGMDSVSRPHQVISMIDCNQYDSWEAYLDSRDPKTRHEMRRKERQLERSHQVEYRRYRPDPVSAGGGDPAWELYSDSLAIARTSWQSDSLDGNTLSDSDVQNFLADAHSLAARQGMLDMNLLYVDGQPAAFFYGYQTHGIVRGLRMGYDPQAPKGSGAVLLGKLIEDSFALGDKKIDLGAGPETFKKKLRTSQETTYQVTHIRPAAWRPRLLGALRNGHQRLMHGWPKQFVPS